MNRIVRNVVVLLSTMFMVSTSSVMAGLKFSGKTSRVVLHDGTTLGVRKPISSWRGVLEKRDGSTVQGEDISFKEGTLADECSNQLMTADFSPNSPDTILLNGDKTLNSDPGSVIEQLEVSGTGNVLKGHPMFNNPITLQDADTTLRTDVHSSINQDVNLNGGTLILDDSFIFGDDNKLTGSGTIEAHGHSVELGGKSHLNTSTIVWDECTDLRLNAKTILSGLWTFSGQTTLNGNGNVLDLDDTGTILIEHGSTLFLNDVTIKNLGDGMGCIAFAGPDSMLCVANSNFQLSSEFTTTMGGIRIEAASHVDIREHDWIIEGNATMTVDNTTLWIDPNGAMNPGEIRFGSPIENHYTSVNTGTIKIFTDTGASSFFNFEQLIEDNSNAILEKCEWIENNSTAIITHSDAIAAISDIFSEKCELIENNSHAIITHSDAIAALSMTLSEKCELIENNSHAIITHSDAIASLSETFSEKCELIENNSHAIITHSDAIASLSTTLSEKCELIENNSHAIITHSDAIASLSETFSEKCELIENNSHAIITHSDAIASLSTTLSEKCELIENNSHAIITHSDAIASLSETFSEKCELIENNSHAIITHSDAIASLSTTLSEKCELIENNSHAIITHSDAIASLSETFSEKCELIENNSHAIITHSDAIASLSSTFSEKCELIINNSDAIVNFSFVQLDEEKCKLIIDNSNSIITHSDAIAAISFVELNEEKCELIINNSDAIVSLSILLTDSTWVLTDSYTECLSRFIHPNTSIIVEEDVCIDGCGAKWIFCNPGHSQFIVREGKTVTLKNLNMLCLNRETFDIRPSAKVQIAENVLWELSDDITFSNGRIEVVNGCDGSFVDVNTFNVRGNAGVKRLIFSPLNPVLQPDYLELNHNTMAVQDIEIIGEQFIEFKTKFIDENLVVGAVGLAGGAVINVEQDSNLNFVIEGLNNEMRLLANNIELTGFLLYGDFADNELRMDFALTQQLVGAPQVLFGDNFVFLTSFMGRAGLTFEDYAVTVFNQGSNSFVVSDRSFLGGENIQILNFPIKQTATSFGLESGTILTSDQVNAIDSSFVRSPFRSARAQGNVTTGLHLQRQKEMLTRAFGEDYDRSLLHGQNEKLYATLRSIQESFGRDELLTEEVATRAVELPTAVDPELLVAPETVDIEYNNESKLSDAAGNIFMTRATLTDFGINPFADLNLTMFDGSTLSQAEFDTELADFQIINVVGKNNRILVTKTFNVYGRILLDEGAELIFEFDEKAENPTIIWDASLNNLSLPARSRVEFKGKGTIQFTDGSVIKLDAAPENENKDRPLLVVSQSARLRPTAGAPVVIQGNGRVLVDAGAHVDIREGEHLIFGSIPSVVGSPGQRITESIDIRIDRGARVRLESLTNPQTPARVSLQSAFYKINVEQGGSLSVGNGGIMEVNALNGVRNNGYLTDFTFNGHGIFEVQEGGRFEIALNYAPGARNAQLTTNWNILSGSIVGGGILSEISGVSENEFNERFEGVLKGVKNEESNAFEPLLVGPIQVNVLEWLRLYLNTSSKLNVSALFCALDGQQKLRLKNGRIITLLPGDVIANDVIETGFVYGINEAVPFHYDLNGTRR